MEAADNASAGLPAGQSVITTTADNAKNTTDPQGFPLEGAQQQKPPPKLSFSENSSSLIRCVPNERAIFFVKIDCDEDSDSLPLQFEWSRGELPIANSDRLRITQTSTAVQLAVEHVQREDAGHYTLIARTKGNDVIRKDVELIVEDRSTGEDPPVFLRRLVDLSVKVGTRTRLLVEIRSSTDVKLTWYRNDRRICENDRIHEVNEGNFHYLEVSPVILEDGGQWMVLAENSGGRNSCIGHLNVLVPKAYKAPEFIEELRAVLTQQGTVSLECKVIGVPTPQLRWFKDSKEIKAGDVFALTANLDDPTSLGTYTCEAVNCMGKSYSSSKVHVVGRGSREGSLKPADSIPNNTPPPIFTNELRDMSVRIGEPIILGCQVVVPPWPKTVVWYNKNGRIESGERYKLIEDGLGVYMIEIKPSESCDEGEWKCVVTSYEGCMGISTCNVTMDIPKNYRKPRFMESLRAVLTEEGLVSFECKVVGFPTPILKWFKDGQELKPGDVYQLTGTNSLGTYCCVAKNCMGESSSVAVLTVEDIQTQLNDEERLLFANQNQPPKFVVGLKSQEAKINESFQFTVNVKATPDPVLSWFRDELPIENSERYSHYRGEHENWHLDIRSVEFVDQAEWKCVAVNDFGTSVTSSYLKLQIPRHYKKPRFLECLRAVLTEEGAVNLECKVIGVPQPVLKWYKDGVELKPGDIHRIISGQDGTCCLGTYTCEARNCMGIVASSASLLGFEDACKTQKEEKAQENELQRNFSLSTIQEEHTSQLYETPVGDITIDSKGEVSFSFDGKEVSVSLYETPDLTEEEALKIVEMYADQISEHVTEHNVVELPPLRFVKETSQSGKLLMEAVVIDISPEYFSHEEDMRTEAGLDDISITEITVHGSSGHENEVDREAEKYTQHSFEKMEEELSLTAPIRKRKKSRPTETTEEFYSLSKASDSQAGDEDTSDLQTFASATQMSSRVDSAVGPDAAQAEENIQPPKRKKGKKQTDSDSSKTNEDDAKMQDISGAVGDGLITLKPVKVISSAEEIEQNLRALLPLAKLLKTIEHHLTVVENEVVEQATMMMTPASAEQSIAIIRNIVDPIKQVQSKLRVYSGETPLDALFQTMEEDIRKLHRSLQVIEKCVEIDETGVTLIQRTSVCIIDSVGDQLIKALGEVQNIAKSFESTSLRAHIDLTADDIKQGLEITQGTIKSQALLQEAQELEAAKHLSETVAKLQAMPAVEPVSFATISDAKLPNEADALKLICLPVVNLQAALEKVENELSLEENEEQIYRKVHRKVLENIVEPIKELQSVLETIERKTELSTTQSTEQKVNNAILDIVTAPLFELNKGLEVILNQSSDNVQAGMLTVSTVESMVPPLQEIQNGLAQLTQDVERGHFNEEAALDSADTQKLLQTIAQSVLHFETNIERLSARLSPNVQKGLFSLKEEMSSLIGNVLDDNITKYHVTLLENLKRPIDELNYCIRQIESKSISGSLTDFIDPLHSLSDRVNLAKEIMHMSGTKQNDKNVDVLEKMQQLIRNVEIDIEEHEFKMLQHEVELDEKLAAEQEKSFIYMREAMEMKIAQDEAGQNIQELLHTLTEIEATPGLDTQTQEVLSQLDQSLTGLVADVEVLKESQSTREENEAATKVLTDIAKPLQTVAEVLRNSLTPEKVPKIESVPQSKSLNAVLQEIKDVVENIPDINEHHIKLKALPIVQSVIEMVPVLQSITNLPRAITAVTQPAVGEKKKAEPDVDNSAAKKPKLDAKAEIDKEKIMATPKVEPVGKIEDEGSTLEDISAMKSAAESLPADSQESAAGEGTDHLKAFEANKGKVNTLLSQLKNSIASVLAHCTEADVASLQLESAQKVKACLSKLEDINECIADVHQPIIVDTLHTHSDISNRKTFADAVCHLETCVVQVEECLAQHDLQELSENSVSDLKTLALPLQDLKECIKVFHNEELEQVISLPTASLSMTSAQVLQDIHPFVLSIKDSNALETLQSLAADESLAQLQQFIQPIQELEDAVLSTIHQVHLSQIEDFPSEVSIAGLEKCAKPILDIREALLHVQAETPQSPIEECPALQVVRQKADAIYNLLEYCERASLNALENITDMSTQADVSALKSCAELKSVDIGLEPGAKVAEESVKYLDVKECIAGGIKQIQVCLTSTDTNKEPELQDIGEVMKELKNELENMQNELSKPTTQQNTVKVNQKVAKTMFKLKECLVHTYETDVGKSLDEIEKTFEDILQALPTLEIHLAQEMFTKIDTSLCAFKDTCLRPDAPTDLQKLVDPINNILKTVKSISELKSIDIEKSSLVVASLQTHLMSAFRVLNEVGDSLSGQEREAALRAQDAVLATHEFIVDASEQLRTIELLQEIDSLTPNLSSIYNSIVLAKEQKNKQELLEALTQRVSSGKAFLQSIEEGLNANNPLYYKLAEENELDIRSVEAALLRIENEIIPKLELQIPTPEDSALVDVLGVHLKSLQDSFAKLKTLPIVSKDSHGDDKQKISETSLISKTLSVEEKLYAELQQRETSLPADEDVSTLEDVSAIESLIGSPLRSHDEHIPSSSADVGKVDVLLSQLKSSIVSVLKYGSEVQVDFQELESTEPVKASLLKLEKIHECFADVGHPSVNEPPVLSFSEASDCKTFADAVCNLEACVVQVEECIAQSYLQDLSETEISELKTLAQPLHDVRECIKIFQNEELEQVLSLPTISMPLTSAQVLQDIQPFILSIKESHALETLQSLAEDESLVQLKQFIQPIQELQNLSLLNVEQVHLSQADSISKQENVEMLKRFAKPVLDIREALLQIQEETPLSTLEECVPLKVVREKIDVVYHLLQYCEQVDMSGVENVVDMSTQADISALKSCIEPQSAEAKLELPAVVAQANVKFLDVKEGISNSIKQLEACAADMKQVNVPELREVLAVTMELGNELESMQNELATASEQQHMAESQAKVAKVMFKLKDCLVHTYEAGVDQSLEHIERAFADLLQTMPILEIQLAQEMCTKMESAILEFSSICNKSESLVELRKLIEPLELVLSSTKAINKLQLIEVEKSTMVVANLQSHLMAVFRAVDQINEKIELDERKNILKLQNSVISISEFISTSENTLRIIELIQELDSLMPQLNSVVNEINAEKSDKGKQAFLEALTLSLTSGKALIASIEVGLKSKNPVFVRLSAENTLDIQRVCDALVRIETEILPKMHSKNPSVEEGALVDTLRLHLKNLQAKLVAINNETVSSESEVKESTETIDDEMKEPVIDSLESKKYKQQEAVIAEETQTVVIEAEEKIILKESTQSSESAIISSEQAPQETETATANITKKNEELDSEKLSLPTEPYLQKTEELIDVTIELTRNLNRQQLSKATTEIFRSVEITLSEMKNLIQTHPSSTIEDHLFLPLFKLKDLIAFIKKSPMDDIKKSMEMRQVIQNSNKVLLEILNGHQGLRSAMISDITEATLPYIGSIISFIAQVFPNDKELCATSSVLQRISSEVAVIKKQNAPNMDTGSRSYQNLKSAIFDLRNSFESVVTKTQNSQLLEQKEGLDRVCKAIDEGLITDVVEILQELEMKKDLFVLLLEGLKYISQESATTTLADFRKEDEPKRDEDSVVQEIKNVLAVIGENEKWKDTEDEIKEALQNPTDERFSKLIFKIREHIVHTYEGGPLSSNETKNQLEEIIDKLLANNPEVTRKLTEEYYANIKDNKKHIRENITKIENLELRNKVTTLNPYIESITMTIEEIMELKSKSKIGKKLDTLKKSLTDTVIFLDELHKMKSESFNIEKAKNIALNGVDYINNKEEAAQLPKILLDTYLFTNNLLELCIKLQTADYLPSKQKEAGSPVSKIEDVEVQEVFPKPDENEKIMQEPCEIESVISEVVALVTDSTEASELARSIVLEAEVPQTEMASKEPEATVLTATAESIKQKTEVVSAPVASEELALTVIEAVVSSKEPKAMELNEASASVNLEEVVEQAPQSVESEAEVEAKTPVSEISEESKPTVMQVDVPLQEISSKDTEATEMTETPESVAPQAEVEAKAPVSVVSEEPITTVEQVQVPEQNVSSKEPEVTELTETPKSLTSEAEVEAEKPEVMQSEVPQQVVSFKEPKATEMTETSESVKPDAEAEAEASVSVISEKPSPQQDDSSKEPETNKITENLESIKPEAEAKVKAFESVIYEVPTLTVVQTEVPQREVSSTQSETTETLQSVEHEAEVESKTAISEISEESKSTVMQVDVPLQEVSSEEIEETEITKSVTSLVPVQVPEQNVSSKEPEATKLTKSPKAVTSESEVEAKATVAIVSEEPQFEVMQSEVPQQVVSPKEPKATETVQFVNPEAELEAKAHAPVVSEEQTVMQTGVLLQDVSSKEPEMTALTETSELVTPEVEVEATAPKPVFSEEPQPKVMQAEVLHQVVPPKEPIATETREFVKPEAEMEAKASVPVVSEEPITTVLQADVSLQEVSSKEPETSKLTETSESVTPEAEVKAETSVPVVSEEPQLKVMQAEVPQQEVTPKEPKATETQEFVKPEAEMKAKTSVSVVFEEPIPTVLQADAPLPEVSSKEQETSKLTETPESVTPETEVEATAPIPVVSEEPQPKVMQAEVPQQVVPPKEPIATETREFVKPEAEMEAKASVPVVSEEPIPTVLQADAPLPQVSSKEPETSKLTETSESVTPEAEVEAETAVPVVSEEPQPKVMQAEVLHQEVPSKEPKATETQEFVKPEAEMEAKASVPVVFEEPIPTVLQADVSLPEISSKEPETSKLTETSESVTPEAEVEAETSVPVVSEEPQTKVMQAEVLQQEVPSKDPTATETPEFVKPEAEVQAKASVPATSEKPTTIVMQTEEPQLEVSSKEPEPIELTETVKPFKPEAEVEAKASEEPSLTVMEAEMPKQEASFKESKGAKRIETPECVKQETSSMEPEHTDLTEAVKSVKPEAEMEAKAPVSVISEKPSPQQDDSFKEPKRTEITETSESVKPEAEEAKAPVPIVSEESTPTVKSAEVVSSKTPEATEITESLGSVKVEVAGKSDFENLTETASTCFGENVKKPVDDKTIDENPIKGSTETKVNKDLIQQVMVEQEVAVLEEPLNLNLSGYCANIVENVYIIRQLFEEETHSVFLKKISLIDKDLDTITTISEAVKMINNVEKSSEKMVTLQKVLMNLFITFDDLQQHIIGEIKNKMEEVKSLALSEYEKIEKSTGVLDSENVLLSISSLTRVLLNVCQDIVKEENTKHKIGDVIETKIAEDVPHEKLSNEKQEEAKVEVEKAVLKELDSKDQILQESIVKNKGDNTKIIIETKPAPDAEEILAIKKSKVEVSEVQEVQKEIIDQHELTLSEKLSKNLQKYFENIASNVDNVSFIIATPQLQESFSKMVPVIPTLRTVVLVAECLKSVHSFEKSAERIVTLQKSLMDTFVTFDDLHEIATKDLKTKLEAVKTIALELYDNIENATKYVESEGALKHLNKLSNSILEVANALQTAIQQNKEKLTENILETVGGTEIQIDREESTEATIDKNIALDVQPETKLSTEEKISERKPEEEAETEVALTLGIVPTDNKITSELLLKHTTESDMDKSLPAVVVSQKEPDDEKPQAKQAEDDELSKNYSLQNKLMEVKKKQTEEKSEAKLDEKSIIEVSPKKPQNINLEEKIAMEESDKKPIADDVKNIVYSKLEELFKNITRNVKSLEKQTEVATHPLLSRGLTSLKPNLGNFVNVSQTIKSIELVEKSSKDIVTLQNSLMNIFVTFDDLHDLKVKDIKCKIEDIKVNALAVYDFIEKSQNHINSDDILQKISDLVTKILKTCSELRKETEEESIERFEVSTTEGLIFEGEPKSTAEIEPDVIAGDKIKEESTKALKTEVKAPVNQDLLQYFNQIVEYVESTSIKVNSIDDYHFRSKLSSSNLTLESIVSCAEHIKKTNTVPKSKEKVVTLQKNLMDIFILCDDLQTVKDMTLNEDFEKIKDLALNEHNVIDKCVDVINSQKILKDTAQLCQEIHSVCEKITQYVNTSSVLKEETESDENKKLKEETLKGANKDMDSVQEMTEKSKEKSKEEKTEAIVDCTKIKSFEKPTEKLPEEILKKEEESNIKKKTKSAGKEKMSEEVKEKEKSSDEILQSGDKPKKESEREITEEKPIEERKKTDDKNSGNSGVANDKLETTVRLTDKPLDQIKQAEEKPGDEESKKEVVDEEKKDDSRAYQEIKVDECIAEPIEGVKDAEEKIKKEKKKRKINEQTNNDEKDVGELDVVDAKLESREKLEQTTKKVKETEEKSKKERRKKSVDEHHKNDDKQTMDLKIAEKELESGKKPVEKSTEELKQLEEKSEEQISAELQVKEKELQSAETPVEKPLEEIKPLEEKPKDKERKDIDADEEKKDNDEQKEPTEKPPSNLAEELNKVKDEEKNAKATPIEKSIKEDADEVKDTKQKAKDPKTVDKRQESKETKKGEEKQNTEKSIKSVGEEKKFEDKKSEDLKVEQVEVCSGDRQQMEEKTIDIKEKDIKELTGEAVLKSEQLKVVGSKSESEEKIAEKDNKQTDEKPKKQRRKKSSDDEKKDHDKKSKELQVSQKGVDDKRYEEVKIDTENSVPLEEKDEKKQDRAEVMAKGEKKSDIPEIIENKSDEKPKKPKRKKSPDDEKKDNDKNSKELKVITKVSEPSKESADQLSEEIKNIDEQLDKEKAKNNEDLKLVDENKDHIKTPLTKSAEEMNQKINKPKIVNEKSDEVKKSEEKLVVQTHPESVEKTGYVTDMAISSATDRRLRKEVADAGMKQVDQSKTQVNNSRNTEYKDKRESRSARRAPNVDLKLTNRNSPVGSDIKLTCSVSGAELKIDWYRDKTFIENDNKYHKTFNDGLSCLEIKAVDAGDAGVYRCVATNRNGEVETSCLVTVYDVPTTKFGTTPIFTRNIRDSYHKDRNEITLECKVSGNPKPQIYWQKDNTLLPLDTEKYKYVELGDGVIQLLITEPVKADTGLYTCYAENDSGQMKISKFLDISDYVQKLTQKRTLQKVIQEQEPTAATHQNERETSAQLKSKVKDEKLKLTAETTMKPMSIAEGNKVQLIFYVSGYIEEVYWLRGEERVMKDTRHKMYNINGAISLEIHNARADDTGTYKCVVRNNKNTIESSCDLTVYEQTTGRLPSSFADNIKESYDANRNEITLSCQVHGRPNVTWLRDDHSISNNRYKSTEEVGGIRKLIIRNPIPSDCGIFACFAETNEHIHAISKSIRTGDLKQLMTASVDVTTNGEYVSHMRRSSQTPYETMTSNGETSSHFTTEEVIKRSRERRPLGMISQSKPLFSTLLHDRTVAEGSSIRLSCNVVCDGDTRIEWLKNHRPLPNDGQYLTMFRNGIASLDIAATSVEDSGNYTCRAINDYGETFTHAQLRVYKHYENAVQPSAFVQSIRDTYSINENTLVLDCRVRGKPRPDIQWMKGSDLLNEDDRYNIVNSADGYTKLTINNPTEKDSGLYACVARNEAAENKITHQVDFVGRERFALEKTHGYFHRDPNKPHFVVPLSNQTVSPGGTVAISAEFMKSSTPLEVQWLRNRQTVAGQPGIKTFMEGGVYTLAILNAQPEVEGTYTCRASNAFGRIESHVSVDVAAGAPKNERPPLFLSRPEPDMKILVGDPFSISFRIAGEPKPKLTFLKGTKDITKSDRVSKEVSDDYTRFTVQSSQIADSGTYFVVARNNFGTDRVFVTVAVKAPKRKESSASK